MKSGFQAGDGFPHRAFPVVGDRSGRPAGTGQVEKGLVPQKTVVEAAVGRSLSINGSVARDFLRDEVLRVPELAGAGIRNASQDRTAGRAQVGGENRLPDNQNTNIGVAFAREEFADCGGPPQTRRSSGREKQYEPGACGSSVEGARELGGIGPAERGQGLLAGGRPAWNPEVGGEAGESSHDREKREQGSPVHAVVRARSFVDAGREAETRFAPRDRGKYT